MPMQRIALVAPGDKLRDTLVRVADAGVVQLDEPAVKEAALGEAAQRLQRIGFHDGSTDGAHIGDVVGDGSRP
jgi:hypothetical protein